jgi:hypothetical protein
VLDVDGILTMRAGFDGPNNAGEGGCGTTHALHGMILRPKNDFRGAAA